LWKNVYLELGHMGKKKPKIILEQLCGLACTAVRALLLLALITGCKDDLGERLQSGRVLAWQGLQGRWVGPVVPTEHACGATTQGLMSIGDKQFALDPFQSTTVVRALITRTSRSASRRWPREMMRSAVRCNLADVIGWWLCTAADNAWPCVNGVMPHFDGVLTVRPLQPG
jgi:hypothetical protein